MNERALSIFSTDDEGRMVINSSAGVVTKHRLILEKITKFLLTAPGSNIADPNYGTILGDKAYLARNGGDANQVEIIVANAVATANNYFKATEASFNKMSLTNIFQSSEDSTVFFVEIFVYFNDGNVFTLTPEV